MAIVLDKWQQEALDHKGHLLLCTGRQIGKTYILSRKCAERMINGAKTKIIIASLTEEQAKLIISMILRFLEDNHKKLICSGKNKPTQNKIMLKNGSVALARPVGNTGDSLRGFTGDILVLDEVSRFNELILTAARPTLLSTGGEIWMASTPYGKKGYFWDCFQNKDGRFKVIHKSSEEAIRERPISQGWTEKQRAEAMKFLDEEKNSMSVLQYGQEYLGLFMDDLRQFFDDELIQRVCVLRRRPNILKGRSYYLGVDLARMGDDDSTFEILDKIDDETIEHVENVVTKKTLTTVSEDLIINLNSIYDEIKFIAIDAGSGSLGVGIFDHLLRNDSIKSKLIAINNRTRPLDKKGKTKTRLMKEDLYDNLRVLMEKKIIKLLDDDSIRLSLKSIQYEYVVTPSKETRVRIFGDYSHIVEGIARAAYMAKEKSLNVWMDSIRI